MLNHSSSQTQFKVVQVDCASFLEHMTDKLTNITLGFSLLGGKNPFQTTDERAYDMYTITHMSVHENHVTDDGFSVSMKHHLAFSEDLESYCDTHLFSSVRAYLPALPDAKVWQLRQISLTQINPQNPTDIAVNDPSLIPVFSGQLMPFSQALTTILAKQPDESFCLLYESVTA